VKEELVITRGSTLRECDAALVPHMTTQSVSGLTLSWTVVFHPS